MPPIIHHHHHARLLLLLLFPLENSDAASTAFVMVLMSRIASSSALMVQGVRLSFTSTAPGTVRPSKEYRQLFFLSFSGGKSRKCFSFFLVRKIEVMTFGLNSSHAAAKHVKWITHWFFLGPAYIITQKVERGGVNIWLADLPSFTASLKFWTFVFFSSEEKMFLWKWRRRPTGSCRRCSHFYGRQ